MAQILLDRVRRAAEAAGLVLRGAFQPRPEDAVPPLRDGSAARTLVLLGFAGRAGFPEFARSPEYGDGRPHPLDRWSRRLVEDLADVFGGEPLFPFGGPPWHPFQRWAARAEDVRPSPLGLFIHPVWGLWHSYRGAIAFPGSLDPPAPVRAVTGPCDACAGRPCLSACPVGAYTSAGFDVARCATHLASAEGGPCMEGGCLARRACPVGARHAHGAEQAAFTMRAFRAAHPACS